MALISVVTTCHNAQDCIEKTIRSVLSQDFRDFEYIIMDGGSTDGTVSVAESFRDSFDKAGIDFAVYSEKDHGIYEGMNHGLKHASGEYVNFLNADDCLFEPGTLTGVAKKIEAENRLPDIFYGDAAAIEFGERYRFVKDLSLIEKRMPFSHQSVFARRTLLTEIPFCEQYRIGADYDFLLSAYRQGRKFCDLGMQVCIVTLDGLSSLALHDTFVETVEIQRAHGIDLYSDKTYRRKIRSLKIKQFVMDHFPKWVIFAIRKIQRIHRGQNEHC
ncbi:MAG: glycosyltransferase [Lachnospiraceae bacterium]|nr:glycosyltransferase [Lachnospiraceae bacterium]